MADDDGTISWTALCDEIGAALGDRTVARWLCEEASGLDREEFLARSSELATEGGVHRLDAMVARYRAGEPLQYVVGHWPFRRLDLMVDQRVLIPRPETELLVEHAAALVSPRPRPWCIVDLGTGSGAIGLSLAAELRHDGMEVWLTDVSADALDVARANLSGIGRAASQVRVAEGSWFAALPGGLRGRLDLVVANPPYVAVDDPGVEDVVRRWEPHTALFSGGDGLDDIRRIALDAVQWLAPGGGIVVEIGSMQGAAASAMFTAAGAVDVVVLADLSGRDRFVQAKRAAT